MKLLPRSKVAFLACTAWGLPQSRLRGLHGSSVICPWPYPPQSGNNAAVDAKRKELEAKRAAQASRGEKTFYKVTVRVSAWI